MNTPTDETVLYYPDEVVCLIGEERFEPDFINIKTFFECVGCVVIGPWFLDTYKIKGDAQPYEIQLNEADHVMVINSDGTVSDSVKEKVKLAEERGLDVVYMVPIEGGKNKR